MFELAPAGEFPGSAACRARRLVPDQFIRVCADTFELPPDEFTRIRFGPGSDWFPNQFSRSDRLNCVSPVAAGSASDPVALAPGGECLDCSPTSTREPPRRLMTRTGELIPALGPSPTRVID